MSDATFSFEDILEKTVGDIEAPPRAPIGDYICQVSGPFEQRTIEKKDKSGNWNVIEFKIGGVAATDSVDPDDLEAFGGAERLRFRHSFMFDSTSPQDCEATLDRMKRFIVEHLEADVSDSMSTAEMLAAAEHCQAIFSINYEPRKNDPEVFDLRVKKTAPVG